MGGYTGINLLVFLSVQSSFKLIQGGVCGGGEDTLELTCQSFCLSKCLSRLFRVGVGRLHWNYLVSLSVCPSAFQGYSGFRGGYTRIDLSVFPSIQVFI